jgi:hypothetical protein
MCRFKGFSQNRRSRGAWERVIIVGRRVSPRGTSLRGNKRRTVGISIVTVASVQAIATTAGRLNPRGRGTKIAATWPRPKLRIVGLCVPAAARIRATLGWLDFPASRACATRGRQSLAT